MPALRLGEAQRTTPAPLAPGPHVAGRARAVLGGLLAHLRRLGSARPRVGSPAVGGTPREAQRGPPLRPGPCAARGRATASAGALGWARHAPGVPRCGEPPTAPPGPPRGSPPPPPAREDRTGPRGAVTGGSAGAWCCLPSSPGGPAGHHPGGGPPPTGLQGTRDARRCACRRGPWRPRLPQARPPRPACGAAPVPWWAWPGLAMAHAGGPRTGRTGHEREQHAATRSG